MMFTRSACARTLMASTVIVVGWTSTASADCLRRVYNRSAAVLVASQDGGPAFVVRPGRFATVRLSQPGHVDLTAYCAPLGRLGQPVAGGREAAKIHLEYEAVLDRCYMKFGDGFFQPDLGPGFVGTKDTAPFTVNNPNQGDIVLGPFNAECTGQN